MKKKSSKFILDIAPLTKIPLTRDQFFCYISDEKLSTGTLVSIPLFNRKVEGIVINSRDDFKRLGNITLKKINTIIEKDFLTPNQLKLAQFISDHYISPLGVALKGFVPKQIKRIRNQELGIKNIDKKIINLTNEQEFTVNKIIKNYSKFLIHNSKFLLFGPSSSGKTEIYIHSIMEIKKKNKNLQFLILVPEKTLTSQAVERYGAYFKPEEIALMSSNITAGQFYSNWKRIKSGEAKIIIATRKGVFAPYKNLGLIVVDEEQDISFKQWDMNPRYDARYVAEKLGELHRCPVVFGSATPSVESYYRAINKNLKLLELPELPEDVSSIMYNACLPARQVSSINARKKIHNTLYKIHSTIIVDMRLEKINKNQSCISRKLKSEIAYALKNKLQTILFINRQGMSAFSVCDSCKTVLKCPICDRALVYDKSGTYRCVHCPHKSSIVPACSKCKGIIFKNIGLGTQKVEKEISNLFPDAKTARIDSYETRKSGYQEKIYKEFSENKIDILIGTQMIGKGWDLPNVSLVGIIDADNILSLPDFSGSARFFQNIVQVSGRVSRPGAKFPGIVVLQTFQPDHKLIKLAAERDFEKFYATEIAERKALDLPPFSKLAKLIFQDYSYKKAGAEAIRVYNLFKNIKNTNISEPQDSYVPKIRGRFRRQIVIKYKQDISPRLRKALNGLGHGWIIDVEPVSII